MRLLENLKLHMWLTLVTPVTMLFQSTRLQ